MGTMFEPVVDYNEIEHRINTDRTMQMLVDY